MKKAYRIGLGVVGVPICVVLSGVVGLFLYMNATVRPLHPDPRAVSSVSLGAPPPAWADTVEQARQIARAGLVEQNLPGLSVAVGTGSEVVWAEGFGWADLEKKVPVRPETRFRTGSISMALTSAAVGRLMEKDKLHLDAEIQTVVPAFPDKQWPLTLRQLMAHTAGVRNDEGDEESMNRCERTADGLQRVAEAPLLSEPGTKFRPSTYGWILVSAAVEAAAGEPFFAFMQTQIFKPLGMRDTAPDYSSTAPVPDRAAFYYPKFAGDPRYGPDPAREGEYSCFAGGGAFLSTPSDLVRFGMAFNGGKLLQPATVSALQSAQRLASGDETGYALGWDLESLPIAGKDVQTVGHDSEFTIGSSATLLTIRENGIVVAVMTNTTFAPTEAIATRIAQVFVERGRREAIRD